MPIVQCKICKTSFYAKPFWIRRGYGIYCSAKCQHEGRRNGKVVNCFTCGTEAYKPLKALKRSKSKTYFCTKSCQTKWRNSVFIGARHANWKNGAHVEYRNIMRKHGVEPACKSCGTKDERVLCVHHRDKNRSNNGISNLVWLCYNCHHLVHHFKVFV